MTNNSSGKKVNLVGMIIPDSSQGEPSMFLSVPGDADYRLFNQTDQPLLEWVYERVYVSGWLSNGGQPVLTVEQLEVLDDSGEEYWGEDEY